MGSVPAGPIRGGRTLAGRILAGRILAGPVVIGRILAGRVLGLGGLTLFLEAAGLRPLVFRAPDERLVRLFPAVLAIGLVPGRVLRGRVTGHAVGG